MRLFASIALFLTVVLSVSAAHAQVNTEVMRKRIKVVGYTLILEGTFTGDTGNTQGITAGGGIGGGWGNDKNLLFAYARADYARYTDVTSVNKSFAHIRYNYEFTDWLWGEAFAQAQSDQFERLTLRNLFGIGPRFRVVHGRYPADQPVPAGTPKDTEPGAFDVFYGTAYMFDREVISPAVGESTGTLQLWHRWSNYLTAQWEVDERVILSTTLYFEPAFEDFSNILALDETLFSFKVTKLLVASLSGSVRYNSQPPSGVVPTDVEVKNSLALTF